MFRARDDEMTFVLLARDKAALLQFERGLRSAFASAKTGLEMRKLGKPSNVQGQWRQSRDNGLCRLLPPRRTWETAMGFEPIELPSFSSLSSGRVQAGRFAGASRLYEAYGTGQDRPGLVWADNVVRHTNRPVLILTPLALVSRRSVRRTSSVSTPNSPDWQIHQKIVVTNYERLHYFNPTDFIASHVTRVLCLKDADSKQKRVSPSLPGLCLIACSARPLLLQTITTN